MTHIELWQMETATPVWEKNWLAWVEDVEKELDVDTLDGDSDTDGYSLDAANTFFNDGLSPKDAAVEFRAIIREIEWSFKHCDQE